MESTFDKEITLDCLQKIKDIPAMIPIVKKIISDLGHRSLTPLRHEDWREGCEGGYKVKILKRIVVSPDHFN